MSAITTFAELERIVIESKKMARVVLACAHDDAALPALVRACGKGIAEAVLVGDALRIETMLRAMGENPDAFEIVNEQNEDVAAHVAVGMVRSGNADIPMKGHMQTSSFMYAVLDREQGLLEEGALFSECTVAELAGEERLALFTDCALAISPSREDKRRIALNAAALACVLGIAPVRIAILSAVEKVSPKIPSTIDAAELAAEEWPDDVVVEGPLALDNAIFASAAMHKGTTGKVAGKADVVVVPDLVSGNVLHKAISHFSTNRVACTMLGSRVPVIMTSRSDSEDAKYLSILLAVYQVLNGC